MQNQQPLFQELTKIGAELLNSVDTVSRAVVNKRLSDSELLQLQTHCAVMGRLAVKLRQHITPNAESNPTSGEVAKAKCALDPHAEKRRWWRLSHRDFKIIIESFRLVKDRYEEALDAERRGVQTEDILNALADAAYYFDQVAHLVFEANVGFEQSMTHFRTDLERVTVAELAPQFDALAKRVDFFIEHQPTGKATHHDLEKLHKLTGIMATAALQCVDDFYPKDWIPETVDKIEFSIGESHAQ
ncbi:hypothetical protein A1507_05755 [Methylomonas koyamae]|uniref:Uncharacterized protein n=1 Tax=Methylomonas koyamae TaxID=702114 RepID=A0A177NP72_9GAMM|nr:hypothetical protein [Methylomonas koyamae]OAI19857.1 hypothetical protein A1507_05755 [Methylomonas koyamae]